MNKLDKLHILTVTSPDIENGIGYRVTIWFAGCSHHCLGCHNIHTWKYNQGELFSKEIIEKIYNEVDKNYIRGITLSGGDPLDQSYSALQELYMFLTEFKNDFPEKDIWVYTGDTFENLTKTPIIRKILSKCDVLVDGLFIKDKFDPDIAFRGSTNQRIIDIQKTRMSANGDIVQLKIK